MNPTVNVFPSIQSRSGFVQIDTRWAWMDAGGREHSTSRVGATCLMSPRLRLLVLLTLFLVYPSTTFAEDPEDGSKGGIEQRWGISIWGLSYHFDRNIDYDERNWGLGIRYYARPQWKWLGRDEGNRVFLEADALRNSHGGLVLPLSAGVQYRVKTFSGGRKLFAVGALTLAYYQNLRKHATELKFGPVPGLTLSWGRVRTNMIAVLKPSKPLLAAIAGSVTIVF
jgi:hypothetical protein